MKPSIYHINVEDNGVVMNKILVPRNWNDQFELIDVVSRVMTSLGQPDPECARENIRDEFCRYRSTYDGKVQASLSALENA